MFSPVFLEFFLQIMLLIAVLLISYTVLLVDRFGEMVDGTEK